MRTTVEIDDENRAALLRIAARRGEKGFSGVLNEAIEAYLRSEEDRPARVAKALAARGSFTDEAADELRAHVKKLRREWR